ncbi:MAG: cytochrome C [Myxococcales bacterium]
MRSLPLLIVALLVVVPGLARAEEAAPAAPSEPAAAAPAAAAAPSPGADGGLVKVPGGPPVKLSGERSDCLGCHSEEDMVRTLKSGEELPLYVDEAVLQKSVHAKHGCTDCHVQMRGTEGGHPKQRYDTRREFTTNLAKNCETCHVENGKLMKDSVHRKALEAGKKDAATCVDCHGGHDAHNPAADRKTIDKTCGKCHAKIEAEFVKSVHGEALLSGNPDVPACTDCHASHAITDPKAVQARLNQPDKCGTCHSDPKKMEKYGISPNVLKTYLADFHGSTVSMLKSENQAPLVALCTDCHGIHDIVKTDAPNSHVLKANLTKTCQKCHPQAKDNFPASWLSHYEPTLKKAPLVYGMSVFYKLFIPFVIGGLILQIGLHLRKSWRHSK